MKYVHKFISLDPIGYRVHLQFSKQKLSDEKLADLLHTYCMEYDGGEDELVLDGHFGDANIEGSTMKMYPRGMESEWFFCYCGTEEIKETTS